jgi:hypothetical protein
MLADALHDPQLKLRMLKVADSCDWLAQLAEDRLWRIAKRPLDTRPSEAAVESACGHRRDGRHFGRGAISEPQMA